MVCYTGSTAGTASNHFSEGPYPKERLDFDDSANVLWSLYEKEAKTYVPANISAHSMDNVLPGNSQHTADPERGQGDPIPLGGP